MAQLASEMQPVMPFFSGVENRFLESWDRFGFAIVGAATVGQTDGVRLRNPTGSGVVAVLEKMRVSSALQQEIDVSVGPAAADLTTASFGGSVEARQRARSTSVPSSSVASPGALLNIIDRVGVPGATAFAEVELINTVDQELQILPGWGLQVQSTLNNANLSVSWLWRERALEDSELTG